MNQKYIIGLISGFVLLGVAILVFGGTKNTHTTQNNGRYCAPDGSLSEMKSIQSHRSFCLKLLTRDRDLKAGILFTLSFTIVDDEGDVLKNFEIDREKLLHFIVVRQDLQEFQHVHPELDVTTGIFTLRDFSFPTAGPYKVYADFVTPLSQKDADGNYLNAVVMKDVMIAGSYSPVALAAPEQTKAIDGYSVMLKSDPAQLFAGANMISFAVTRDGKPVTDLENYLGSLGHTVVIRNETLDYIHAHAVQESLVKQTGNIDFHVEFPMDGKYKLFMQFKHKGQVRTIDFMLPTVAGEGSANKGAEIMEHSVH